MTTDLDLLRQLVCEPEHHDHPDAASEIACAALVLQMIRAGRAKHLIDRLGGYSMTDAERFHRAYCLRHNHDHSPASAGDCMWRFLHPLTPADLPSSDLLEEALANRGVIVDPRD